MAYSPVYDPRFKRGYKKLQASGRGIAAVDQVLSLLVAGFHLPVRYWDHALKGEWKSYRECHVKRNVLLIYRIEGKQVRLARLGSHAELFE